MSTIADNYIIMTLAPSSKPTYHSKIYERFMEIEPNNFHEIISFYEEQASDIAKLEFNEFFELLVAYVNSLFETAAYEKHIKRVDTVIENSILRNIQFFKGEDIYRRMLFKKAASLYNLHAYEKADYILRELVKIDPFEKDPITFLKKCLRKTHSSLLRRTNAISILLFLFSAIIIAIEVLSIRPFYPSYINLFEISRNCLFFLACFTLIGGNIMHRIRIEKEVNEFVENLKQQKLKQ